MCANLSVCYRICTPVYRQFQPNYPARLSHCATLAGSKHPQTQYLSCVFSGVWRGSILLKIPLSAISFKKESKQLEEWLLCRDVRVHFRRCLVLQVGYVKGLTVISHCLLTSRVQLFMNCFGSKLNFFFTQKMEIASCYTIKVRNVRQFIHRFLHFQFIEGDFSS